LTDTLSVTLNCRPYANAAAAGYLPEPNCAVICGVEHFFIVGSQRLKREEHLTRFSRRLDIILEAFGRNLDAKLTIKANENRHSNYQLRFSTVAPRSLVRVCHYEAD
jgi:hypothetical protein